MGVCAICGREAPTISKTLGLCCACLLNESEASKQRVAAVHGETRVSFNLPPAPCRSDGGITCTLCSNACTLLEGERGFCGLRIVRDGRLVHLAGTPRRGLVTWHRDPLPTNCVADWVCEGKNHQGSHNLAVYYESCTANCLYCQNWHYRKMTPEKRKGVSAKELASAATDQTFCVCFFGGDPTSQMPHALAAARSFARRGIRVCWDTNGTMHPKLLEHALELSLETGGCIKFDLKASDDALHTALTGISKQRTLENFVMAVRRSADRPDPPLVIASTLLVPGYVEAQQVGKIARFIASLDTTIPYTLLGFAPQFYMSDLPYTSVEHAAEAESAARAAGLQRVRIGNRNLIGWQQG